MSTVVPADEIEQIVGLHSHKCLDAGRDLRSCRFTLALDRGIEMDVWGDHQDEAVRVVTSRSGSLVPVVAGMRLAR